MIDQRRFERVPFFCDVSLTVLPDGPTVPAHCFDISLGGVGLVSQAALEPGRMVAISFSIRDKSGKEVVNQVSGRVARCHADSDANQIGVEFLQPLSQSGSPQLVQEILEI